MTLLCIRPAFLYDAWFWTWLFVFLHPLLCKKGRTFLYSAPPSVCRTPSCQQIVFRSKLRNLELRSCFILSLGQEYPTIVRFVVDNIDQISTSVLGCNRTLQITAYNSVNSFRRWVYTGIIPSLFIFYLPAFRHVIADGHQSWSLIPEA